MREISKKIQSPNITNKYHRSQVSAFSFIVFAKMELPNIIDVTKPNYNMWCYPSDLQIGAQ